MLKKLRNKKGFTLAELLIVVAIIGVLVAISIPIFTTQLEKSREAVDISNMRAAYAVAQSDVLTESWKDYNGSISDGTGTLTGYYDGYGKIVKQAPKAYGKSSVADVQTAAPDFPGNATFTWDGKESGKVIQITITLTKGKDPTVAIAWADGGKA
jgi:prepilin-type N-terminal cleavage/methylation domain-containing protein